jgi:hypothetical protein
MLGQTSGADTALDCAVAGSHATVRAGRGAACIFCCAGAVEGVSRVGAKSKSEVQCRRCLSPATCAGRLARARRVSLHILVSARSLTRTSDSL